MRRGWFVSGVDWLRRRVPLGYWGSVVPGGWLSSRVDAKRVGCCDARLGLKGEDVQRSELRGGSISLLYDERRFV